MAHFEVFRAGRRVGRVEYAGYELAVGRDESSALRLADPLVSRMHARIFADKGKLVVEDLKTSNGTFVNGRREYRRPLNDGDRIELGAFVIVLRLEEDEVIPDTIDPFAAAAAQEDEADEPADGPEKPKGATEIVGPGLLARMRQEAEIRLTAHLEQPGTDRSILHALKHSSHVIGAGDRCHVRIPQMKRAEAARLDRLDDGSFRIKRLGWFSRMTVEGEPVRKAQLKGNEELVIGGVKVVFRRGRRG